MAEWRKLFVGGQPITFREHRGTLEESLKTAVHLTDIRHLPLHLSALTGLILTFNDIVIHKYCDYDDRTGTMLYMVRVRIRGELMVMGFIDVEVPS